MKQLTYIFFILATKIAFANITLPSIFTHHMVLQQQDEVKIWGWADPNEAITISPSWSNETYKAKTTNQAHWELKIKTPKYGGPYTITISGYNEIVLKDILIGEVWLCSGQSNMEMSANWGIKNGDFEVSQANYPNIRFFNIPKTSAKTPQNNVSANWEVCTPESMKHSSAIAYFFAKRIQEHLKDIPVGLIISAWGGTPAEIWTPENVINKDTTLLEAANKLTPVEYGPTEPARAFNAMINPILGYNIAGTLWYQGEANVGSKVYSKTLTALITSWRQLWHKDFPFYLVQIAPYKYGENHFGGVEIRNAQRNVANQLTNTEIVVISDISTVDDIHPKDKKSVGNRLANIALKKHYNTLDELVESPTLSNTTFKKNKGFLTFEYAEGLYLKDKQSLFEVAGEDKLFYAATCKLKGETIIISSKKVKTPKYVRFAWGNTTQSNLFNKANLPTSSFSTEQ
ncbi:sialate O-acetylesterase [Thalassobellus citreus]|uniref:sialate O-acetylesterase n=1 Tax=Thalassobellus citreus TaxID=3367752 RepID=UPI0037953349